MARTASRKPTKEENAAFHKFHEKINAAKSEKELRAIKYNPEDWLPVHNEGLRMTIKNQCFRFGIKASDIIPRKQRTPRCICSEKTYCAEHFDEKIVRDISMATTFAELHVAAEKLKKNGGPDVQKYLDLIQERGDQLEAGEKPKKKSKSQQRREKVQIEAAEEHATQVIPPPPYPADTEPQLYTLHAEQIIKLLQDTNLKEYLALVAKLKKCADPTSVFTLVANDRSAARYVFEKAGLQSFFVKRFLSDTEFHWTARIAFRGIQRTVAHDYRLHFVLDPRDHFDRMGVFEGKLQEVKRQPSLLGEIDDDRLREVERDMADERAAFEQLQRDCPDIILDLETQGSEYTEKGWTVIKFKLSAKSVADLNDRRENMKKYKVLLKDITQA